MDRENSSWERKSERESGDFERKQEREFDSYRGGKKHNKKSTEKLAAKKSTTEERAEKFMADLNSNPQKMKMLMKVALFFTVAFMVCLVGSYLALLTAYKRSAEKYHMLMTIYNTPGALVVDDDEAQRILSADRQPLQSNNYMPPNAPGLDIGGVKIQAPTLKNLPRSEVKEPEFNYSLCESIDYQQESFPPATIQQEAPRIDLATIQ